MKTILPFALLLCVSLAAGEKPVENAEKLKAYETGTYSHYVNPGKPTVSSQVLGDIMWEITQLQFKELPPEQKKFPEGTTEADVLKRLKERIPTFPCVLVTAEEEEKFKAGTFDEAPNFVAYMDFMKIMNENRIQIPYTLQVLQRDQAQGKLKGARLELAVRFAFMAIAKVVRSAEKK